MGYDRFIYKWTSAGNDLGNSILIFRRQEIHGVFGCRHVSEFYYCFRASEINWKILNRSNGSVRILDALLYRYPFYSALVDWCLDAFKNSTSNYGG